MLAADNQPRPLIGDARETVQTFVTETLGDQRDVDVEVIAVQGEQASAALIDAAQDADLLVVGSRGVGGFKGLLLGSVSQQCAHHSPCPVVIVGPSDADDPAASGALAGARENG
jgi:nucleotide-binding universal stress UspA family protein